MTIMKKAMYFMVIAMLIVACQPNNEVNAPFEKGQKVILSATLSSGSTGAQQLPGKQRVSGKDNTTDIKLTWDKGDQIKVTVDGQDAVFTLIGEGGSAEGTFEGSMPADGTNYTVTYPVTYDESVLTSQTYVENGFRNGLLSMSGSGTLDDGFTLTAQNAVLELSLKGSGNMGRIVVSDKTNSKTYTLDCNGVTLDASAKSFYMVVPAGNWKFKAEVYDDHSPKPTETFETSSTITFTAGEAVIMPTKEALLAYELKTLTFEDDDENKMFTPYSLDYVDDYSGKEIKTWSDLIDEEQNMGALLNNGYVYFMSEPYWWHDNNNTQLMHTMPDCSGMYGFTYGCHAISNYASTEYDYNYDYDTYAGDVMEIYNNQLTVYGDGGHNNSTNFALHYGFTDTYGMGSEVAPPALTFEDGKARVIDHLYINMTTIMYDFLDYYEDSYAKIIATGYDKNDEEIGSLEFDLYNKSNIVNKWTIWELSGLGKVLTVEFTLDTSDPFMPASFAYDDVAVRFPK